MLYLGDLELNKVYGFVGVYGAQDFIKYDGEKVYYGNIQGNDLGVICIDKVVRLKDVRNVVKQAKELGCTVVKGSAMPY